MSQQSSTRLRRGAIIALPVVGVLALAGCSGGGSGSETGGGGDASEGFSIMVAQANDQDVAYNTITEQYTEETGVPVEVIPYPSDAYNTQVTTQLQAGNAADMMVLSPGTGQPISVINLADADFLEPLDDAATGLLPAGTENQFQVDGTTYAQPTSLSPVGFIYNAGGAAEVGIDEYPTSYEDLIADCGVARDGGKTFTVLAGSAPFNTGLLAQIISATRVYAETPDWNEQRAAGDVTFADSGWADVLETIVEMNDAGCFQDGAAGGTFDNITAGIGGGTSLTAATPGSAAASIGAATGLDITVQAFPPADGQTALVNASPNYAFAINAASSDARKAAAQAFLDWIAEPENAQTFADDFGAVSITGITADDLAPSYAPVGELLEAGDYTGLPNASWPNAAVYDTLGAGVQALLTGQKTIDQVLSEMDTAWDN